MDWFFIIPFVDTLMVLTFTTNKLTISKSLALCAFLISCDINYPGVQDVRIDVIFYYWIKFIQIESKRTLFFGLNGNQFKMKKLFAHSLSQISANNVQTQEE